MSHSVAENIIHVLTLIGVSNGDYIPGRGQKNGHVRVGRELAREVIAPVIAPKIPGTKLRVLHAALLL